MEVFAPPGKLGVVIDTPDIGPPIVYSIKDSSCIADKIQVGDKLFAVDDEDVRDMTAIKAAKAVIPAPRANNKGNFNLGGFSSFAFCTVSFAVPTAVVALAVSPFSSAVICC